MDKRGEIPRKLNEGVGVFGNAVWWLSVLVIYMPRRKTGITGGWGSGIKGCDT